MPINHLIFCVVGVHFGICSYFPIFREWGQGRGSCYFAPSCGDFHPGGFLGSLKDNDNSQFLKTQTDSLLQTHSLEMFASNSGWFAPEIECEEKQFCEDSCRKISLIVEHATIAEHWDLSKWVSTQSPALSFWEPVTESSLHLWRQAPVCLPHSTLTRTVEGCKIGNLASLFAVWGQDVHFLQYLTDGKNLKFAIPQQYSSWFGRPILSSAGTGKNCALPLWGCQAPAQHWIKIVHSQVQKFYPVLGLGSWRKAPKAFPDSSSVLDKISVCADFFLLRSIACFEDGIRWHREGPRESWGPMVHQLLWSTLPGDCGTVQQVQTQGSAPADPTLSCRLGCLLDRWGTGLSSSLRHIAHMSWVVALCAATGCKGGHIDKKHATAPCPPPSELQAEIPYLLWTFMWRV